MRNIIFVFLLVGISAFGVYGQELSSGYIKMEITDIESDDPTLESWMQTLLGSESEYYFNEDQSLVVKDMMGGMIQTRTLLNHEDNSSLMYFNMMGDKMLIENTYDERKSKTNASKVSIEYVEDDTKEILGYQCVKVNIHIEDESNLEIIVYVSRDIRPNSAMIDEMEDLELDGFPLEYKLTGKNIGMTYTTTALEEEFDPSVFDIDGQEYRKMSNEEFEEKMKRLGGGPGGFGG